MQFSGRIKSLVDEVNVGSEEQARGIDQVSNAVIQMRQMTQQTAGNAQETASAGQELDSYAEALNKIVCELDRLVGAQENGPANAGSEFAASGSKFPQAANPYSVQTEGDWSKREFNIRNA